MEIETNPKQSLFGKTSYFREQIIISKAIGEFSKGLLFVNPEQLRVPLGQEPFPYILKRAIPESMKASKGRRWFEKSLKSLESIM